MKPQKINETDPENIVYGSVKKGKIVSITYNNKKDPYYIQSTELLNVSTPVKKDGYYELDIPLIGENEKKVEKFRRLLKVIDGKGVKDGKKHSKEWMPEKKNMRYKNIIRSYEDKVDFKHGGIKLKLIDSRVKVTINGTPDALIWAIASLV
jgi:hypothetical protein